MAEEKYLFTSLRLIFRNWVEDDVMPLTELNQDPAVMKYFPSMQSEQQTREFILRMKSQCQEKGFCYFAVDQLGDKSIIGFIGLSVQTFDSDFTPSIDIGWRLKRTAWSNGYATEGA